MFGMHCRSVRSGGDPRSHRTGHGDPNVNGKSAATVCCRDLLAAPMAAIMSTINAQLLQSSATIIKDLYLNIRPDQMQNETRLKRMSAVITLVLGALLLLAARKPPEMIIWLNLLAFGGLEAVFLWPLVLGLYWERANAKGALSAMIVGGVLYAVLATLNIQYRASTLSCPRYY